MSKLHEVYKCPLCQNIVEVLSPGGGTLVCCGKEMIRLEENSQEAATEKHVPVVEMVEGGVLVKVGSVEHPMQPEHHIQWIEVITKSKVYRKHLTIEEKPEAFFKIDEEIIMVREYCNLHGLWKA